jgi:hypothetical protein
LLRDATCWLVEKYFNFLAGEISSYGYCKNMFDNNYFCKSCLTFVELKLSNKQNKYTVAPYNKN